MKRKITTAALFAALVLTLGSCVQICVETGRKYDKSTARYPDLVPLTVDEIALKMREKTPEYKILYIYDVCEHRFGKYISQTLVPYLRNNPSTNVGIYAIANDCAWLQDIQPEFKKYGIDLKPYYIRDNSPAFVSHGKDFNKSTYPDNRFTRIARHLFTNAGQTDLITAHDNCYIVNAENKVKLARFTCNTKQGVKSVVAPCPIERIAEPLDQVDFDTILDIELVPDPADRDYLIHFWKYDN